MGTDVRFPRLVAETLSGRSLVLPDGLDREIALVAIAFRRHAQSLVDSWLAPVSRRFEGVRGFTWFEVPMLAGGWRMISGFIDGGMRSGIPVERHDQVATCYGDTARFRNDLDMHDLDSAYVFLVDDAARVLWRGAGWATQHRLEGLLAAVEDGLARAGHNNEA